LNGAQVGPTAAIRALTKKPSRITRNGIFQPRLYDCLGRKRFAAATALASVGVGDFEAPIGKAVTEVHHGAAEIISAEGIHQDGDAMHLGGQVVRPPFVEDHGVLHAGTTALFYVEA